MDYGADGNIVTVRLLKSDEYDLLKQIPAEHRAEITPDNTIVAASFEGDKLVGALVLINLPNIECAWVHPEQRSGTLLGRMESLLIDKLRELGARKVIAFAVNEQMEDYTKRLGYARFASAWIKGV